MSFSSNKVLEIDAKFIMLMEDSNYLYQKKEKVVVKQQLTKLKFHIAKIGKKIH